MSVECRLLRKEALSNYNLVPIFRQLGKMCIGPGTQTYLSVMSSLCQIFGMAWYGMVCQGPQQFQLLTTSA